MPERLHTIAEIGCSLTPFVLSSSPHARTLTNDEMYIGVDFFTNPTAKKFLQQQLAARISTPYMLLRGNALQLPLQERSVDEIVICNVLTTHQAEPNRELLLREAARAVREKGTITVVETYTPERHPLKELLSLAKRSHLKQTNPRDEHDSSEIIKYNSSLASPTKYIATFSPR